MIRLFSAYVDRTNTLRIGTEGPLSHSAPSIGVDWTRSAVVSSVAAFSTAKDPLYYGVCFAVATLCVFVVLVSVMLAHIEAR